MQAQIMKSGQILYFYQVTLCLKILWNGIIAPFYWSKNLECIIFNFTEEVEFTTSTVIAAVEEVSPFFQHNAQLH